jgi:hypothetical protein
MLQENEYIEASDLNWALGERPYGHYDHDSQRLSGPYSRDNESDLHNGYHPRQDKIPSTVCSTRYEAYKDPQTGDILYRPIEAS